MNGRLEPVGHVEGFTAEVGASGAFCPPHIVLPVSAAFYNLHDSHGGTSPYLVIVGDPLSVVVMVSLSPYRARWNWAVWARGAIRYHAREQYKW